MEKEEGEENKKKNGGTNVEEENEGMRKELVDEERGWKGEGE